MSGDFAKTAGISVHKLVTPVGLQLATAGSRTTIKHGCETTMNIGKHTIHTYWDIGHIDYFDAVLGIQALRGLQYRINLDTNQITLLDGTSLIADEDIVHPATRTLPTPRPFECHSKPRANRVDIKDVPENRDNNAETDQSLMSDDHISTRDIISTE